MKDRSDVITREIQTHSSDIPLDFLVIVCGRRMGSGEQTQDGLLSQQGLKLTLISVVDFHLLFINSKYNSNFENTSQFAVSAQFLWSGLKTMLSKSHRYYLH